MSLGADAQAMLDPYDPRHPDGLDDADDLPGSPMTSIPWLDDGDPSDEGEWEAETLACGACGRPAVSWNYLVDTGANGNLVIDGYAVCEAHRAAA